MAAKRMIEAAPKVPAPRALFFPSREAYEEFCRVVGIDPANPSIVFVKTEKIPES